MAFIRVNTTKTKNIGHRRGYYLESDLDMKLSVQTVGVSPVFKVYEGSSLLFEVSYSGFHKHKDFYVNEWQPKRWSGFHEGTIGFNDSNIVLVNEKEVGKIEFTDPFAHIADCLKQRQYKNYEEWIKISFDETEISKENALALVLIKLSFFES